MLTQFDLGDLFVLLQNKMSCVPDFLESACGEFTLLGLSCLFLRFRVAACPSGEEHQSISLGDRSRDGEKILHLGCV